MKRSAWTSFVDLYQYLFLKLTSRHRVYLFTHSFISEIYIALLQETYSEALQLQDLLRLDFPMLRALGQDSFCLIAL